MTEQAPSTADAEVSPADDILVDAARLGERLGRYQLVLPLAQGGMGLVFAGRLLGAHGVERLVAIKTLRPITSGSDRAALLREARLTSRLHHRNVVATLDLGEVDDVPYVVMELVDGVALSRLLGELKRRDERLSPELAAWIVMQAALGLHAAHELADADGNPLGLVHRDVSPQNILLSMQGEVKIADFGIAKYTGREESTATGMIKGKFAYMSPEQAQSGELDRTSDVFALGIVLWEALTGDKLFSSETPARTILRVLEHTPASPSKLRPEVGDDLAAIAEKALAKSPSDRYPTAAAMADALRGALRAQKTPVDEGDLATLVKRLFGEERARMMERIKTDPAPGETETSKIPAAAEPSALVALSISTHSDVAGLPKRAPTRRRLAVAGALAAIGIAVAAWSLGGAPVGTHTSETATSAPATAVPASATAEATAPATATTEATATATATATGAPLASASAVPAPLAPPADVASAPTHRSTAPAVVRGPGRPHGTSRPAPTPVHKPSASPAKPPISTPTSAPAATSRRA
jgi:serine/threonine protein kinase